MLNIFKNQAFNVVALTDAINVRPNMFGRLNELGIFPDRGVRTRTAAIERKNHVLNLLPTAPVGAPASKGTASKRDLRSVAIPHIPHEDVILAEDIQGVRAFGSESELQSMQELVVDKLDTMTNKHDITLEYLRWGALKGQVVDSDGTTVLLNLFTEFGVTQEVESFALTTTTTEVMAKINALKRYMELHLFGDTMSGIQVFCAPDFFDALITHASVKAAYQYFRNTQMPLSEDYRNRFIHGGVIFEEQNGTATDSTGGTQTFVPAGTAIAIPLGTQTSFRTYWAPADFMETVNTPGLPRYAKQRILDYDRGIEIHTQSNPLPICLRPQLLVKLTKT